MRRKRLSRDRRAVLRRLERRIRYRFRKPELLNLALTHTSHAHEEAQLQDRSGTARPVTVDCHNESMEFLGDSVLGLVVADVLCRRYADWPEGKLSQVKAALVSESPLARCGLEMGLGEFLLLGKGEQTSGGAQRVSTVADAVEALIAAVYLDGGMRASRNFILRHLAGELERVEKDEHDKDYKSLLQELTQSMYGVVPKYQVASAEGPNHRRIYEVVVRVKRKERGRGKGTSKKEAERKAAEFALKAMGGGSV